MTKKFSGFRSGPGYLIAAAFIGPGTLAVSSLSGARYGFTLIWVVLLSVVFTIILQEMTGRLGTVGKKGLAEAVREQISNPFIRYAIMFLIVAGIFIGNSAYEAGNLNGAILGLSVFGFDRTISAVIAFVIALFLLLYSKFHLIEKLLTVLVGLMGLIFFLNVILLKPDVLSILHEGMRFEIPDNSLIWITGIMGTTVVPYNLFLHASASKEKAKTGFTLLQSRVDTVIPILIGGVITACIMITSAVLFEGGNTWESFNESVVLSSLGYVLGDFSEIVTGIGFFAAGLSSAITAPLAAGLVVTELFPFSIDKTKVLRFVSVFVLVIGALSIFIQVSPFRIIVFAQFINGLLLPVIVVFLLYLLNNKSLPENCRNNSRGNLLGGIVLLITSAIGMRSILWAIENF